MSVPAPVTPDLVRWALEEDGRPYKRVAEALEVAPDVLLAWAEGHDRPSKGQVTKLAAILKRPRALFFLPAPPVASALPAAFRHPPGADRDVGQESRLHVRRARRVQDAVSWSLREAEQVSLPRMQLAGSPEAGAADARTWLGVTDEDQLGWGGQQYEALSGWKTTLDESGILVFTLEMGRGDVRGFSCWDDWAPMIALNSSSVSAAARVFTLGHELGHLVTRSDAACIEPTERLLVEADVERWCERFSAALLMPAAILSRVLPRRSGQAGINEVMLLMRALGVSARAAALRLIDLDYAPHELYSVVEKTFRPAPAREVDSSKEFRRPGVDVLRERAYGQRAIRQVLNTLPESEALRVLRLTVQDARKLTERVPGIDAVI